MSDLENLQAQCVEAAMKAVYESKASIVGNRTAVEVAAVFDRIAESGYVICKADDLRAQLQAVHKPTAKANAQIMAGWKAVLRELAAYDEAKRIETTDGKE